MSTLVVKAGEPAPARLAPGEVIRYEQLDASLTVRRAYCKGCLLCIDSCPSKILKLDADDLIYVTDIDACIFCGACAGRCPDFVFVLDAGTHNKEVRDGHGH
ncbi:MAG: 4Fe-4S binding protein [Actinomycetota bacterium]|nr:4Fe-4S binding protein [Actinomycetota bacterium]